ncbi:MAG TPA: SPFH domain-containing protein [Propionibacteriaceae bacterium]|nr:SPFH domain-containing protein [Propionibacteriaceae bacterium]
MDLTVLVVLVAAVIALVLFLTSAIQVIRQQRVGVVERLGKFNRTLEAGPHLVVPIVDKVRYNIDMREAVVPFPPQGVITEDNLMVNIDSVIYFQVIDPVRAAYEAQDYIKAIEQLTMTTLRNIIGGLDLESALVSREEINQKLRLVLDEATGKWGIKVNRVELRAIDPPATIRDAMEKGARAERDKRASILIAEGQRQSQILSAGGEKESAILRAQGDREAAVLRAQADRQAQMLRAEGEAQAITTVFGAIHAGEPDQALLAYQYMQMLPSIARGDANKVWIVPSELNRALEGLGSAVTSAASSIPSEPKGQFRAPEKVNVQEEIQKQAAADREATERTVQEAIAAARELETATPKSLGVDRSTPADRRGEQRALAGQPSGDEPDLGQPSLADQPQQR